VLGATATARASLHVHHAVDDHEPLLDGIAAARAMFARAGVPA
jgi:hypothetical protein